MDAIWGKGNRSKDENSGELPPLEVLEIMAGSKEVRYEIGRLATTLGYSVRHFGRLFRAQHGCAPSKWRDDLIMRKAIGKMGPGVRMKSIAADLPFANQGHFSRAFSRITGVSP